MSTKGLTVGQVNMFCNLLEEEFSGMVAITKARVSVLRPAVRRVVEKEVGVMALQAQIDLVQREETRLKNDLKHWTNSSWVAVSNGEPKYVSRLDAEIDRRLAELDGQELKLQLMKSSLIKSIKLSAAPAEVKAIFDNLEPELNKLREEIAALPPVRDIVRQIGVDPDIIEAEG